MSKGFWTNKNGQALFNTNSAGALALLDGLNLVNANGTAFNPTTYAQFKTWLGSASATNMAYMLSAQLASMELNVFFGKVGGTSLIYAPGTTSANANGFATVNAVMSEANTDLGAFPNTTSGTPGATDRAHQSALESALDNANNDTTFVQPTPATCGTPTFKFLFRDNFNGENGGGTVDLIGNGFYDFYPGNGLYIDLDGSTTDSGVLATKSGVLSLPAGTYTLSYELGGSQRCSDPSDSVVVALSGTTYSETLTRACTDPPGLVTRTVTVPTATSATLSFHDTTNDNIGAIPDDVTVAQH
jgi:hypothetical protein